MGMITIIYSLASAANPWNVFLTNIARSKRYQTKATSSARFLIKHVLRR